MAKVQLITRVAWWYKAYLYIVFYLAELLDCEVNYDRVEYWSNKGIKCYILESPERGGYLRRLIGKGKSR